MNPDSSIIPRRDFLKAAGAGAAALSLPAWAAKPAARPAAAFPFKIYYGWISEMATRPILREWPDIALDPPMLQDFELTFNLCKQLGFDYVVIWGLCVSRHWPVPVENALDEKRRNEVRTVLDMAHRRGLKVVSGLGVYSWGFQEIIRQNPHLSRTNKEAMCASLPESQTWMNKVTDLVLGSLDVDGVEMQSADQGRCKCPDCSRWSDLQYHARLIENTARYIRKKWPKKIAGVATWGMPLDKPAEFPALAGVSEHLDWIIDYDSSAGAHRKALIKSLKCPYGTLAGLSVWPPQKWERTRWFVPVTTANADYFRRLRDDGGRAIEQFAVAITNPGDEVSLRFASKLIQNPDRPSDEVLRESIAECLEPKDQATADGLRDVFQAAEAAFFKYVNTQEREWWGSAATMILDDGLHYRKHGRIQYLVKMTKENLSAYGQFVKGLRKQLAPLKAGVGNPEKVEQILASLQAVFEDVEMLGG